MIEIYFYHFDLLTFNSEATFRVGDSLTHAPSDARGDDGFAFDKTIFSVPMLLFGSPVLCCTHMLSVNENNCIALLMILLQDHCHMNLFTSF